MIKRESERVKAVNRFLDIEIAREEELNYILKLVAEMCQTSTALITLIGQNTQYIKFKFGSDLETIARQDAICNYTIKKNKVMIVQDARYDDRFANNPLVTNDPNIRFYAGFPLTSQDGYNLGSLCVTDRAPKQLDNNQQQMLQMFSEQVVNIMELEYNNKILKEQFVETKDSDANFRFFFENSSASHVLIGKNLKISAFNKAFAKFIKKLYNKKVTTNTNIIDYVDEPYVLEFIGSYYKALSGIEVQIERKIASGDKAVWCLLNFMPARNAEGEIRGVFFSGRNITKRVKLEQKVYKQSQSLEKIAYIQSHELRKPVASIMGLMNIFKAENYTATKEDLLVMQRAVDELDEKIRLIVNYTSQFD